MLFGVAAAATGVVIAGPGRHPREDAGHSVTLAYCYGTLISTTEVPAIARGPDVVNRHCRANRPCLIEQPLDPVGIADSRQVLAPTTGALLAPVTTCPRQTVSVSAVNRRVAGPAST